MSATSKAVNQILRKQIVNYLLENPIERNTPGCYADVAKEFKVNPEYIRRIYRTLRENGQVEDAVLPKLAPAVGKKEFSEDVKKGEGSLTAVSRREITTIDELVKFCKIDLKEWNIDRWICNKWEVGAKDSSNKVVVTPLFQVKAWLSRRKVETDLAKQKEALLKELKRYAPKVKYKAKKSSKDGTLLEIAIFDPHFGKLAWREETDEDYDLKIAEKRVKEAVRELLGRMNLDNVERILLPVGNDLINIDNRHNTTFAGTPQDSDCRYMKIIKAVKRILIEMIDELSAIAPVDVIIVPGNHDTTSTFMMGEILEAFYHNNDRVSIDNRPKQRKYYEYGLNAIQFTHGDQEKHSELLGIFATEEPVLWGRTKFRFAQLGHFHKNKKMNYVSVDEHHGFQIQILPSLSGTDFWHKSKGYNSMKQAKAMLFHKEQGLIGEATVTVV